MLPSADVVPLTIPGHGPVLQHINSVPAIVGALPTIFKRTSQLKLSIGHTLVVIITIDMPADKDRIYIALYGRSGKPKMPGLEDTYHWAITVGPKVETEDSQGTLYHAREEFSSVLKRSVWTYQKTGTSPLPTRMIMGRIMFGKVKDKERLESILDNIALRPDVPGWNCVGWVQEAVEALLADTKALGTVAGTTWEPIRATAMWYIEQKKSEHRYDGKDHGRFDKGKIATWNMLTEGEIIP